MPEGPLRKPGHERDGAAVVDRGVAAAAEAAMAVQRDGFVGSGVVGDEGEDVEPHACEDRLSARTAGRAAEDDSAAVVQRVVVIAGDGGGAIGDDGGGLARAAQVRIPPTARPYVPERDSCPTLFRNGSLATATPVAGPSVRNTQCFLRRS